MRTGFVQVMLRMQTVITLTSLASIKVEDIEHLRRYRFKMQDTSTGVRTPNIKIVDLVDSVQTH
jgi:hypothetical protein